MPYDHIRILNTLFASGVWYEMTLSEVRVYVAICSHWNWQRLEAYPAINTLAQETCLSRRGVIYALEKLKNKGLIRVVKKGRKNYYQIFDYLFKMAVFQSIGSWQKTVDKMAILTYILFYSAQD